ncbi:universal stress protein [Agromyces sp. SYSU T0242]|uniref:universal stress protein n=1 Tax=Agromyces litoreus TaxID=3158561 RepID=UPI0033924D10
MFTQVVVGWDGSPNADAALRWAAERSDEEPLRLVHAVAVPAAEEPGSRARLAPDDEAAGFLERIEGLRATHPNRVVSAQTVHGRAEKVLGSCVAHDALVVVGASQSGHETAWTLGARLAGRRGSGTVAVIPPDWDVATRRGIVVGVDGSDEAQAAIRVGVEEAARTGEPLELLHAWVVPTSWNSAYVEYLGDVSLMEEMRHDLLDAAVEYARSIGGDPTGRLERGAAAPILAEASETARLVVVGSHAAGGMVRFLLGSVSHDLLLSAAGPVVVVGEAG